MISAIQQLENRGSVIILSKDINKLSPQKNKQLIPLFADDEDKFLNRQNQPLQGGDFLWHVFQV